jgi:hypothetical protein
MSALKHLISDLLIAISEHGNLIAHKFIHWFGVVSISAGATLGAATGTVERIYDPTVWTMQDWAAVVSIAGGLSFVIKNLVDAYFKVKNKGRD